MTARRTLAAALGAGAALAAAALAARALWWEPRRPRLTRRVVRLVDWPAELHGLRLAVLSDLHAGAPHVGLERLERLVARLSRERPELVALLGDYADPAVALGGQVAPEHVAERLARLEAPLGTLAVLGNHDWQEYGPRVGRALADAGIAVLENEALRLERRGAELWVAGLPDAATRRPRIAATLAAIPPGAATIALSHSPDLFPELPQRVALTLSGHVHGSQVDLPLVRDRVTPSRFGARFAGGLYANGAKRLFVTRGVGTSGLPVRLFAPPEVVLLELRGGGRRAGA